MDYEALILAFPFDRPKRPISLYDYAPVLRIKDQRGDWVLKRTGLVHSHGEAIGRWLTALQRHGVSVVAPSAHLSPNPRRLDDGKEWVVYPFVPGTRYRAAKAEIRAAGRLLGQMHSADLPEAMSLTTYEAPIVRTMDWIEPLLASAGQFMRLHNLDPTLLNTIVTRRAAYAAPVEGLPLAGCSYDFKASNLVFHRKPTLIDPDHAARIPRLYDLAVALLLFHCDLPSAPGRIWTEAEWQSFLKGYQEHVSFTDYEAGSWSAVLSLAWLDQAVWLLGNWEEGWADQKERGYLVDLVEFDLDRFLLTGPA